MLGSVGTLKPKATSHNDTTRRNESSSDVISVASNNLTGELFPADNNYLLKAQSTLSNRLIYDADDEESGYVDSFQESDRNSDFEGTACNSLEYINYETSRRNDNLSEFSNDSELRSDSESVSDPFGVIQLTEDFEYLLQKISTKVKELCLRSEESAKSTLKMYEENELKVAEDEIVRFKQIIKECDEIEKEFIQATVIGEIVKDFKGRIVKLEEKLAEI
ncbi:hypothetical protein NADFUDRAFT_49924 [Nadsonia fulvescens var. elongata DSM 6958]|uniref:Biogenesis of lysosome-related organelles complex 1 subunit CNL1 n=1 Tax=Nadsonia fulvescens var. elongata DSM 6958 TaxID=857566 RepID=A0A1E3PPY1_9ASCO|nr:hypothetical protein NADFUDRAFT_49924 [Nadsonia fulvescens var. elongata DSM 6958]